MFHRLEHPRFSCAPFALALLLGWSRSAAAEASEFHESVSVPPRTTWVTAPLEFGHSAAWSQRRSGPLYEFNAAFLPGVFLGEAFSMQASLELHYRNPDWDSGLGVRFGYGFKPVAGGFIPIRVLAGASYLPRSSAERLEGGLSIGLGKLLYVAGLGGYETDRHVGFMSLALGLDVSEISDPVAGITHFTPQGGF